MISTGRPPLFDDFSFDPDRLALYHRDGLIKTADKKQLEVLAALLQRPNELVSYDEIIESVWADNPHGATPARVNQYVSKLQKVLSEYSPDCNYFENVRGRGYIFIGEVRRSNERIEPAGETKIIDPPSSGESDLRSASRIARYSVPLYALGGLLLLTLLAAWMWYPRAEDEMVRQVVTESQMYESLVLYKNPTAFKESDLDKYWAPELLANSNFDRTRIRDAVKKMVEEGRKYGDESKCEQFEFQSVEVDTANRTAVVKTLEKWFAAVYQTDGTLLRNRTIGPYFVSYVLRKIDGRWLIEKSTTGRVNRPVPRLKDIEPTTEARAGQQFMVTAVGQDFEPETIYFEVVGPGCPEAKPCKIPNDVLRGQSKISAVSIQNIPLTLASGEFRITARNGDSQPSDAIRIVVP